MVYNARPSGSGKGNYHMLIFTKERLAFLAVPKTGSTAYQSALSERADLVIRNPPDLKHAPLYRYNRFFRPMFEKVCGADIETLAVMREPISWLGSWYRYRRRPVMAGNPNTTDHVTFDEFVIAYLESNRPSFANVGSQAKFLEPRPNGTVITHLFRYETPLLLNAFLEDRLGITLSLRPENVSPEMDLFLSPDVEHRLRRKCARDFDLYDSI